MTYYCDKDKAYFELKHCKTWITDTYRWKITYMLYAFLDKDCYMTIEDKIFSKAGRICRLY